MEESGSYISNKSPHRKIRSLIFLTVFIKNIIKDCTWYNGRMRLSTQSRYGVRAIFDIAYHSEGLETQVKDISRRQGISQRYLEQIFQKLKKGGIVGSKRGPSGGYFLNKRPEDITVGELIRITEGSINPVLCVNPWRSQADRMGCSDRRIQRRQAGRCCGVAPGTASRGAGE